jgi:uncharacterized repeat protein (TIGR04138 family)
MSAPDETKANVPSAEERLRRILDRNSCYPREAYEFVNESLGYTVRLQKRAGHVTGQELCEGVRHLAVERFGYLARTVLESWNIRRTDDIGAIVYAMIEVELLRRNESDSLADFHDVFDFEAAFDRSFRIPLAKP